LWTNFDDALHERGNLIYSFEALSSYFSLHSACSSSFNGFCSLRGWVIGRNECFRRLSKCDVVLYMYIYFMTVMDLSDADVEALLNGPM